MQRACQIVFSFIVVASSATLAISDPLPNAAPAVHLTHHVALVLDCSDSMMGAKGRAMKEGAKLAAAILDDQQQISVVSFNTMADKKVFSLALPRDRHAAMQHIERLALSGGTDYLAALTAANLSVDVPAIFVSDGEHNGNPADVLAYLRDHPAGPISTIAVQAPPAAAELLKNMAVSTGGSFVTVDRSEQLVQVLLERTQQLGSYRTYKPDQDVIHCADVSRKLIAIGFDTSVNFSTISKAHRGLFSHSAVMPGEQVQVLAVDLPFRTNVTIQAGHRRTPQGRLASIIRSDLARAEMNLGLNGGAAAAGGTIGAATRFYDAAGKPVDPRQDSHLSSEFEVLDEAGRVLNTIKAGPALDEPELVATLPVPKSSGSITVRNRTLDKSSGVPFEALQIQALRVQEPVEMSATPDKLQLRMASGRFRTTLKLQPAETLAGVSFTAKLLGRSVAVSLANTKPSKDGLELEFEASRSGEYRGELLIEATASAPVKPLTVPYQITVTPKFRGLALPRSREIDLGSYVATAGVKQVGKLAFPSLDEERSAYEVELTDLDCGKSVIPLSADQQEVAPAKGQPAVLNLTAELGNVPTGKYRGKLTLRRRGGDGGDCWTTAFVLTVTEPLSVLPRIDLGKVEVGKGADRTFDVTTTGGDLRDLSVDRLVIEAQGGALITTLPDKIPLLAPSAAQRIRLTVTVDPDITSRGKHEGVIRIRRVPDQPLEIPVILTIVDEGEGDSPLLVAPKRLELSAAPGEIVKFEIRIKTSAATLDELSAAVPRFRNRTGRESDVEIKLNWPAGTKITATMPVILKAQLIAPDQPGTYTSQVQIGSRAGSTRKTSVILQVK